MATMNAASYGMDLSGWLRALDLHQYIGRFHSNGIFLPSQCTSLTDGVLLADLGIEERSHRETLLAGILQLSKEQDGDNISDGSWDSEQSSKRGSRLLTSPSGSELPPPLPTHYSDSSLDLPPPPDLLLGDSSEDSEFADDMPPPPAAMLADHGSESNFGNSMSPNRNLSGMQHSADRSGGSIVQRMYKNSSLVNVHQVHQDDFDLDGLLADLAEIEQSAALPDPPAPASSVVTPRERPPSTLSTMSSSSSLNIRPPSVTITSTVRPSATAAASTTAGSTSKAAPPPPMRHDSVSAAMASDDDFSKILADLESLTTSSDVVQSATATNGGSPSVGSRQHSHLSQGGRQASELDLAQQINILSGGGAGAGLPPLKRPTDSPLSSLRVNGTTGSIASSASPSSSEAYATTSSSSSSAASTLSTPRHLSAISPHPSISSTSSSSELEELNILNAHLTQELRATDNVSTAASDDLQIELNKETSNVRTVPNKAIVRLPTSQSILRINEQLADMEKDIANDATLSRTQKDSRLKQAKVQVAMDKLKEANKKKLVLKAYNDDDSSKMIVIDEQMTAHDVVQRLIRKNRVKPNPNYVLVEQLADHFLERRIEDHEVMVPILECWGVNSPNTIRFTEKPDKYMVFKRPQLYMPPSHDFAPGKKSSVSEQKKRDIILKDLFTAQSLPDLEGNLLVKEGRKGPWKRHYFVFRKSGLYFSPKGKTVATKDLQRFTDLKDVVLYTGMAYRKKYKAPSDLCFTLKKFMSSDSRKMLHFCVDSAQDMNAWTMAVRLAQHGNMLLQNYERTNRDMPWAATETEEEIDGLVRMQEEERLEKEEHTRLQRTGSITQRLRMGAGSNGTLLRNAEKGRTSRASTITAAELTLRSRASIYSEVRPHSAMSGSVANPDDNMDDLLRDGTGESLSAIQQVFMSAWKPGPDDEDETQLSDGHRIALVEPDLKDVDDFSPTPMTASPFLATEDGMYNVRLT